MRNDILVILSALLCMGVLGCVGDGAMVTEPCTEGCSTSALVGTACQEATDCPQGMFCNLAFPGGYCQASCDDAAFGDSCGASDSGVCVPDGSTFACLGRCDPDEPASCERADAACYAWNGTTTGVCHLRCHRDADCGAGLACDGQGVCRVAASCDGLTDAGCGAGLSCMRSEREETFCGWAGAARVGQACASNAVCGEALICYRGACAERCDPERTWACGDVGACQPITAGLGVCQ